MADENKKPASGMGDPGHKPTKRPKPGPKDPKPDKPKKVNE